MINLNNKGQSLVMFILIIPILLFVLIIVADIGNALIQKKDADDTDFSSVFYFNMLIITLIINFWY